MEWVSDIWLILIILGIVLFSVIVIILIYILRNDIDKSRSLETPSKHLNQYELNRSQHPDKIRFCSRCGAKIDIKNMNYCSNCGNKFQQNSDI
ncbi:MAG: hypothetical protein ACFFBE_15225 [Promethearchaeota archaeon]